VGIALAVIIFAQEPKAPQRAKRKSGQGSAAPLRSSSQGLSISGVSIGAESFNPTRGEKLTLNYTLSRDATTAVKVFDADRQLVRGLPVLARKAGKVSQTWDGKDLDGKVVPNEAYSFTIEAQDSTRRKVAYDPITFSGGEFGNITKGQLDQQLGTMTYQLSQPSRILFRAGMLTGELFKTVVDWEPRSSGTVTEYWNGKDEDNLLDVNTIKGSVMVMTYMTLPENSVITIGNDKLKYRDYKRSVGSRRPMKEDRPMMNSRKISPHFLKSRLTDRAFHVKIVFPDLDKPGVASGIPTIRDSALIQLSIAEEDKEVIAGQQFEIMVHTDSSFMMEEERGYLPFTTPLEVKALSPGEHTLTINLITFGDQIAVGSRKFRVVR
jgi:hypothetical protein